MSPPQKRGRAGSSDDQREAPSKRSRLIGNMSTPRQVSLPKRGRPESPDDQREAPSKRSRLISNMSTLRQVSLQPEVRLSDIIDSIRDIHNYSSGGQVNTQRMEDLDKANLEKLLYYICDHMSHDQLLHFIQSVNVQFAIGKEFYNFASNPIYCHRQGGPFCITNRVMEAFVSQVDFPQLVQFLHCITNLSSNKAMQKLVREHPKVGPIVAEEIREEMAREADFWEMVSFESNQSENGDEMEVDG